jgi:hypothetical protein
VTVAVTEGLGTLTVVEVREGIPETVVMEDREITQMDRLAVAAQEVVVDVPLI